MIQGYQNIQYPYSGSKPLNGWKKTIVDFSVDKQQEDEEEIRRSELDRFVDSQKGVKEHPGEHPIVRERYKQTKEIAQDDQQMSNNIPVDKRIQRKEEEALGKTYPYQSFNDALIELDKPDTTLLTLHTLFPFDLFPDTITIDPIKVKIIDKYFFSSQQTQTILIKDIIRVYVEEAPLMAALKFNTDDTKDVPISITHLRKADARKARKLISALVISRSESPDVTKLENIRWNNRYFEKHVVDITAIKEKNSKEKYYSIIAIFLWVIVIIYLI